MVEKKQWKLGMICLATLFVLLALSGCNTKDEKMNGEEKEEVRGENTEKKGRSEEDEELEEDFEIATTVEEMTKENPGKYTGNKYNKAIIHRALDNQDFQEKDSFEVYQSLLKLMGEGANYKEKYQFFEAFDPSIETAVTEMPGGITIDGSGELGIDVNIAILLDASGSMNQKVGEKTKMELAKKAINEFVASLPEEANVMLRVYGHKGSNDDKDKKISCDSTEVVYDLAPYNKGDFRKALDKFKPTGWTPIAKTISETKKDFEKAGSEGQNIIYVVSDGIETCDGDPVKAAKDLHDSNIEPVINIIGFDMDSEGQKQLREVAEAGGGKFEMVNNADDFNKMWDEERRDLWNQWWNWGNENWSTVRDEQNKKTSSLLDEKNSFSRLSSDESNRMYEATSYLKDKKQINYETWEEARSLVKQRREIIKEYYDEKYEELNTTVKNEGEGLKESIKKKEEEMKEKYKD
ncbi:VWA domain-containing protein [Peribacillus sp.]|uniref:VWA domain-containing protein n=1 Tax=Peribacillus sp. TaxID=2675267 RepID=UPI00388E6523